MEIILKARMYFRLRCALEGIFGTSGAQARTKGPDEALSLESLEYLQQIKVSK
jgi:hypothetical protein